MEENVGGNEGGGVGREKASVGCFNLLFQSILGFWQSKRRIIIQVQLMQYIYRLEMVENAPKTLQFFSGASPQTPLIEKVPYLGRSLEP